MNPHKLLILSAAEAKDCCNDCPDKFSYISIGSINDGWPDLSPDYKVCRLCFDDIVYPDQISENDILEKKIILPTVEEIQKGIEFAAKVGNKPLVIHCYAGISRSAAMAWLVLFDRFKGIEAATKALYEVKNRNLILPNNYIVKLGLKIFAPDNYGDLYQKYVDTI